MKAVSGKKKKKANKQKNLHKMEIKFGNTHLFTMKIFHYTSQVLHK